MSALLPDPGWPRTSGGRSRSPSRRRALPLLLCGPDALVLTALALLAVRLLTTLPASYGVDSWLEVTVGRLIWNTGVPHHETLTAMAAGRSWIDQQWLSQLASYGLYRLGGLALLGVANVALLMSGVGIALITARRLGASTRVTLIAGTACVWLVLPATEVRTQGFAFPLFSLAVYLLARDSRAPSWRVLWTLPILVLWGNLHGSASVGAGLVVLRGLTVAWERRTARRAGSRDAVRPLLLILGAPLALLVTPYGLSSISYYRSTLGNGMLRQLVTEWQPVTSEALIAVPFFALAGVMIWSFGRSGERTTLWEKLALLALSAGAVEVIRNVAFFALAALALLPSSLEGVIGATGESSSSVRRRVNGTVVAAVAIATTIATVTTLGSPDAHFDRTPGGRTMLAAVESRMRADPAMMTWADTRYADWLLWHAPWLAGRVATDARFEIYTVSQLRGYERLVTASGPGWTRSARGYRLLVLNRAADAGGVRGLLREPGTRVLFAGRHAIVILRAARAAGGAGSTS
jgi:hypothetical protein